MIDNIETRLVVGGHTTKRTLVRFLCVITDSAPGELISCGTQYDFWLARLAEYDRRESILLPLPAGFHHATPHRLHTRTPIRTPFRTPFRTPLEHPNPPPPTRNALHDEANRDLFELLFTILSPEHLDSPSLLNPDADLNSFRTRIQESGVRLQVESNDNRCNILAGDNDKLDQAIATKYTPFLDRFCMPPRKSAIQSFLHFALQIDQEHPGIGILQLEKFGGTKGYGRKLVAVLPGDTPVNFYKNGKQWLPNLYKAIAGNNLSEYDVCFLLTKLHRYHNEAAFEDVCRTKSNMAKKFKLDPYRQIAMFHHTNLTYEQGRGMRPFLNADNCNPLQSERIIRKLEAIVDIKPIFTTFQENKTNRHAWFLPVDDAVCSEVSSWSQPTDELHIILSADHGHGSFRANVAVLFIREGQVERTKNILVGNIECRKDSRAVLRSSGLANAINTGLKKVQDRIDTPLKLKATGDLAWFSLALGKENMSGSHCWRCQLRWSEFQKNPSKVGNKWTICLVKETHAKLESGELKRTVPSEAKGIKNLPLFDCIEPDNWMTPILHAVDLETNAIFDYLQKYVWYRIEDIPLELILAREAKADADNAVEDCWLKVLEAEEYANHMEIELHSISPEAEMEFDDDEHEFEYRQQAAVLDVAVASVDEAKELHKAANAELKKANRELKKLEENTKNYGKVSQDLWMTIQRKLHKDYNVHISSYHGGDMEGNECRRLLRNAEIIMEDIKSILVAHLGQLPDDEKERRADQAEVELFCAGFTRLFQYMDLISHYCYQPYGSMSDADVENSEKAITLASELWLLLMPTIPMKIHAWQHLKEDLRQYRGMKSHNEQQIERTHQDGKKHDRRLRCFRDFEKKPTTSFDTLPR